MERFLPYLGVLAGVILVALSFFISDRIEIANTHPLVASSSVSIVPSIPAPALPSPSVPELTGIATVTPKIAQPTVAPKYTSPAPAKKTTTITPPAQTVPAPPANFPAELAAAGEKLRTALVNILCYSPAGSRIPSISGSGVFIDAKGIILTNAHIAQHFLLADRGVSCVIRTGSPAADRYKAALIFISPSWLQVNGPTLTVQNPIGTGERDIAFLAVTRSATSDTLPSSFPYVPLASAPPNIGAGVVIGTYGAQFLQSAQILSSLFPTLVYGSVRQVYTFGTDTVDVIDLGGSAAAQEGSSGGGVVTADGSLSGTIVTSTVEGDTSTRQLDAITASYIRADYASESGMALDVFLSQPLSISLADFAAASSALESLLTQNL